MKQILFIAVVIFLHSMDANAASRNKRETSLYGGFGFGYSALNLEPEGQERSEFSGWNGVIEAGTNITLNEPFGINLAAEYMIAGPDNNIDSSTYMETAEVNAINLKLGLYWGNFTIGGGYSDTTIKVKNVSSTDLGETTTFKGNPTLFFANYGFENDQLRAVVEAQYANKTFDDVTYNHMTFSVRIFFLFSK